MPGWPHGLRCGEHGGTKSAGDVEDMITRRERGCRDHPLPKVHEEGKALS